MVTADEPGPVTPHAAARNTEAEASQIVRERTNGSMNSESIQSYAGRGARRL